MQNAEVLFLRSFPSSRLSTLVAYTLIKTPDTIRRRKEPQRRFSLPAPFAPLVARMKNLTVALATKKLLLLLKKFDSNLLELRSTERYSLKRQPTFVSKRHFYSFVVLNRVHTEKRVTVRVEIIKNGKRGIFLILEYLKSSLGNMGKIYQRYRICVVELRSVYRRFAY